MAAWMALVTGKPGDRFTVLIDHHVGPKHLPTATLQRAA